VIYGLKLGTALSLAIWLAYASGLDWGMSIWITVMFVAQPNVGASVSKGLARICGTVASALVSIAIYGLFAQEPPLMLASLCGVIALAVYGMTGPRYPYAWQVFGFTTIIILIKALQSSDPIETLSFERASLSALGVLIVFVVDFLFWPVRAEQGLREGLAARSRKLGAALKQNLAALGTGEAVGEAEPPRSAPLISQLDLAYQAGDEIGVTRARARGLSRIALLLEGMASRVRLLGRVSSSASSPLAPPERAALAGLGEALDSALAEASRCLTRDRAPEPFAEALEGSLADFESERMAQLGARLRRDDRGPDGQDGQTERKVPPSTLTPILRDVAWLVRSLEDALAGLAKQDGPPSETKGTGATGSVLVAAREWLRFDPIRVQLGLRAGIASGGAIVAMLAMGWTVSKDILAMNLGAIFAFIVAASPTRGAGAAVAPGAVGGILLGWLIADLAQVFLFPHLVRMPLSLVYVFAVAGGAGYLMVRGSPLGPVGALLGMLTAIMPVFLGDAPRLDVDMTYSAACGELLGVAAGLIAGRLMWPRTAMQTFTERAAAQVDLCLEALGPGDREAQSGERGRAAADLVRAYAKQLTLLGQLHAQAHAEPIERALDDERRAQLLALTQDLFDAALAAGRTAPRETARELHGDAAPFAPLRAAMVRQEQALRSSLTAAVRILHQGDSFPDSGLSEARDEVEARLEEIRGRQEIVRSLEPREVDDLLAGIEVQRHLVSSQLALEAWLTDWRRAAQ